MASVGGSATAPPPPLPPKESLVRRYKFLWPMILAVNLSVGAYLFLRTKKKDVGTEAGEVVDSPSNSVSSAAAITAAPSVQPAIVHEPISGEQQREIFKWILEEKRKLKPKDPEEKRRIDDEKAILKQFIRAKSIPSL
ncbi:uncharacterized protein LOC107830192 [Nicotiana tabacum]|uniref:Uncharacterized protein LOC107830192 n=1 Tax=Nicotiana tabacum TaxID=4097 RepID=A0A1S4DIP9_TOBAC|nr:uncharacterized protein LOC104094178 [Nicotiana tomentosiformis]XP_016513159.1 PREDICTED: uncharacterized protein LOC107830192 [Nicotiana tabacum]